VGGFDKINLQFLLSPNKIIRENKANISNKIASLVGIL
jgi:hypothetical protein